MTPSVCTSAALYKLLSHNLHAKASETCQILRVYVYVYVYVYVCIDIPVLGGGGGKARIGDGDGDFVFLRIEPTGETEGGKIGTKTKCNDFLSKQTKG